MVCRMTMIRLLDEDWLVTLHRNDPELGSSLERFLKDEAQRQTKETRRSLFAGS